MKLARTNEEFAAALVALLKDGDAAAVQGGRGRTWVEASADRGMSVDAFAAGYGEARERR